MKENSKVRKIAFIGDLWFYGDSFHLCRWLDSIARYGPHRLQVAAVRFGPLYTGPPADIEPV